MPDPKIKHAKRANLAATILRSANIGTVFTINSRVDWLKSIVAEAGKLFFLPSLLVIGGIKIGISAYLHYRERSKTSLTTLGVDIAGFTLLTAGFIAGMASAAALSLATPILVVGSIAINAGFMAKQFIDNFRAWRALKKEIKNNPEKNTAENRQKLKTLKEQTIFFGINTLIGIGVTIGAAFVMIAKVAVAVPIAIGVAVANSIAVVAGTVKMLSDAGVFSRFKKWWRKDADPQTSDSPSPELSLREQSTPEPAPTSGFHPSPTGITEALTAAAGEGRHINPIFEGRDQEEGRNKEIEMHLSDEDKEDTELPDQTATESSAKTDSPPNPRF